jgi:UDP-glucose 4-epimerase
MSVIHKFVKLGRILVTGARGFLGRHLVEALLADKDNRLILTDKSNMDKDLYKKSRQVVSFPYLDIMKRESVFDLFKREKIDTCVHLAAKVDIKGSIKNPNETIGVNVIGTLNILDACFHNNIKNFVYPSSASVYGNPVKLAISEDQILTPISPYGISKVLGEQCVELYRRLEKIECAISLRIFNVYGKSQNNNKDVITRFTKRLSDGLPPIINGSGMQKRDFISVIDVVSAILLSIKSMEEKRDSLLSTPTWVFNIGTGTSTNIKMLAKQMIRISGLNLEPIYQKTSNIGEIEDSCADMTKSKKILQFVSKNKLEIGLKNILRSAIPVHIKS